MMPVEPLWSALLPAMLGLNRYAVNFRYPGEEATTQDVKDAIQAAKAMRREARLALRLKVMPAMSTLARIEAAIREVQP